MYATVITGNVKLISTLHVLGVHSGMQRNLNTFFDAAELLAAVEKSVPVVGIRKLSYK
jgi:hypothetical protein